MKIGRCAGAEGSVGETSENSNFTLNSTGSQCIRWSRTEKHVQSGTRKAATLDALQPLHLSSMSDRPVTSELA